MKIISAVFIYRYKLELPLCKGGSRTAPTENNHLFTTLYKEMILAGIKRLKFIFVTLGQ
jgi:hypothetical protein